MGRHKIFRNDCCPFCGSRAILIAQERKEKDYVDSDPTIKKFLEDAGELMECCSCDFVFHEKVFYAEYANRGKTKTTRESYLKLLEAKIIKHLGRTDATFHSLMFRFKKEKREAYYLEDIEIDFKRMLRRINLAQRRKLKQQQ